MDDERPERDEHRITVEVEYVSGAGSGDPGWYGTAEHTAEPYLPDVPDGPCGHRVRWRELQTFWRIVFWFSAAMLAVTALAEVIVVFAAAALSGLAFAAGGMTMYVLCLTLLVMAMFLSIGVVAAVRVGLRLHQPGKLVCILASVGCGLFLATALLVASGTFKGGAVLLVLPPLTLTAALWYFRSSLYPSDTCAEYPWLPPRILAMLRA